jgi:LacI family transcriptional regulator
MTTMHDVARRAGVSIATVSRVVNGTHFVSNSVRERVMRAIDELGYSPNALARSLRKGRTNTLGLVLPDSANPFFAEIGRSVELSAYSLGYNVILCNTHGDVEKERHYIQLLTEKQVDGVILDTAERHLEYLVAHVLQNLPLVMIDRDFRGNDFDIVLSDNVQGAKLATQHLVSSGHERIACITGPPDLLSSIDRLDGYRQILEASTRVDDSLIKCGDFRPDSGRQAFFELMKLPCPPTAVFACNDMMAIGALRAAAEMDMRVPEDISVVGFDDIELCRYTTPTLTSVSQSKEQIGEIAVRRLLEIINGDAKLGQRVLVTTQLIIRGSSNANPD